MRERIQTLDGLRFLAAIGVLWTHTWTAHGNPRFYIGKIDLADFMAIGVNGVELFFVISGFCLYYFYANKNNFSYHDFGRFLIKRFIRLSPAFFVATIIYILVDKLSYQAKIISLLNFSHSVLYLNYLFPQYNTAAHFWTLTVEWQFYFTIPFILIYQNRIGFKRTFSAIFGIFLISAIISIFLLKNTRDDLTGTLIFRGFEFGCGVIAARLLLNNNAYFKNRVLWLFAFIIITFTGRVFVSKPILDLSYYYYNLFNLLGYILMGLGFAGILYLSVTSVKRLRSFLGNNVFKAMGRISFSFYLLHGLFIPPVAAFVITRMPYLKGIMAPVVSTCLVTLILFPVSMLSFHLLEKPYLAIGNLTTK